MSKEDKFEGKSLEEKVETLKVMLDVNTRAFQGFILTIEARLNETTTILSNIMESLEEVRAELGLEPTKTSDDVRQAGLEREKAEARGAAMAMQARDRAVENGLLDPEDISAQREEMDVTTVDLTDLPVDRDGEFPEEIAESVRVAMREEDIPEGEVEKAVDQIRQAWESGESMGTVVVKGETVVEEGEECDCPKCRAQRGAFTDATFNPGETLNGKDKLL